MKKRVVSMLLAVVMMLGMFPGTALAAGSVEEALGEVNIYNGEQKLSYLSINGRVRELIYTYYNYVDRNGQTKEIPAYCVNPNIKGVPQTVAPGESIKYLANEIGSDPKVMGIIANGYPHRSLSELKLENKYQAYYATKMALWAYLLPNWDINNMKVNPNLTGVELERANKMLAAVKDIYRRGTVWSTALSPNVTVEADQETAYIVTDARGVAASDPLPLGRYFVTEVSAPKYYQLSSEKMEAEIEYPNQIIKLSAYNKSANLGVTIKKTGNREVQPGQVMSYDFSGIGNTSNVALNSFFWHDRIPTDATRAISVTTGTYNARLYYKVTFKTNLSDYRTLASNLLTSNNYSLSLNAATLGLAQGEYVTDVRFEFGTVPSGFASVVKPTMRVQVLGTVSNGYQIINRADVGGQYLNEWQTAKATWVTTVCRFNNNPLPKTGY